MKTFCVLAWFLLIGCASAQTQNGSPQSAPETVNQQTSAAVAGAAQSSKVDPAEAAEIRRLMDIAGVKAIMVRTMDSMSDSIRPMLTNSLPPGEYRDKLVDLFLVKFKSKADPQQLLDSIVPLYDKYFSAEEVKALIQFYQTPLGQKTVQATPKIMAESEQAGRKWGEELGRQSMLEVLSEHPELEKALEEAKKGSTSQ